jgi:nicotinamidase-related amidase
MTAETSEARYSPYSPYSPCEAAPLIVDPCNDFLSEGGKLWPRAKEVAEGVGLLDHLRTVLATARAQGFRVFVVPHHRTTPSDYVTWDHLSPTQRRVVAQQTGRCGLPGERRRRS